MAGVDWTYETGIPAVAENSVAIVPGSFDPLTNGHVDVIQRALRIFDSLIVAVLSNSGKDCLFSVEERLQMIRETFAQETERIQVKTFSGLLADFAREENAGVIIRGLRAVSDYDYEVQMALMNRSLNPELETVFLVTRRRNSFISSSMVKQVAALGGDVSNMVPPPVAEALCARLKKEKKK